MGLLASIFSSFAIFLFGVPTIVVVSIVVALTVKDHPDDAKDYERQWYCIKCGRKFHERAPEVVPSEERQNFQETRVRSRFPDYAERIHNPIQKARTQTERDTQGLLEIRRRSEPDGTFSPIFPTALDLGLVSRLASLGHISWDETTDAFSLCSYGGQDSTGETEVS
jgi:hypothetical protein